MKKLFPLMLCLSIFTVLQAQIQKNDKFLYANVEFYKQSNLFLQANSYTQIPMSVRYGQALGKRLLAEVSVLGNYSTYSDKNYAYFTRSSNASIYYMLGKKRLQPYLFTGIESGITTSKNPLFNSKRTTSIKSGAGAFYFFKPQLVLNTKLQFSSKVSSLKLSKPYSFIGLEVELLNLIRSDKFFTKETDSERFLEKGKSALSGQLAYRYALTKLQNVDPGLWAININYERMLNKHFSAGLKTAIYSYSLIDDSTLKAHLGFYGRISNALYAGTTFGIAYTHRYQSLEPLTMSIIPTANLLYFMNKTTAISLEVEYSSTQSSTLSSLRKAGVPSNIIGANIGLKYFLK